MIEIRSSAQPFSLVQDAVLMRGEAPEFVAGSYAPAFTAQVGIPSELYAFTSSYFHFSLLSPLVYTGSKGSLLWGSTIVCSRQPMVAEGARLLHTGNTASLESPFQS
jgi:hypothetical protein